MKEFLLILGGMACGIIFCWAFLVWYFNRELKR